MSDREAHSFISTFNASPPYPPVAPSVDVDASELAENPSALAVVPRNSTIPLPIPLPSSPPRPSSPDGHAEPLPTVQLTMGPEDLDGLGCFAAVEDPKPHPSLTCLSSPPRLRRVTLPGQDQPPVEKNDPSIAKKITGIQDDEPFPSVPDLPTPIESHTASTFVLAYGPHAQKPADDSSPFVYLVYICTTANRPQSPFHYAYGNEPYVPVDLLPLETGISEEFVANLDEDRLRFLVLANHLLTYTDYRYYPNCFEINARHLVHGWVPKVARDTETLVFRYPVVEALLSLSTYLHYAPQGRLATYLQRYHPETAFTIFSSPLSTPTDSETESISSRDFASCDSTTEPLKWEAPLSPKAGGTPTTSISSSPGLSPLTGISLLDPPQVIRPPTPLVNGIHCSSRASPTLSDIYEDAEPMTTDYEKTDFTDDTSLPVPSPDESNEIYLPSAPAAMPPPPSNLAFYIVYEETESSLGKTKTEAIVEAPTAPPDPEIAPPLYSPVIYHFPELESTPPIPPEESNPIEEGVFAIEVDDYQDLPALVDSSDNEWNKQDHSGWNVDEGDDFWMNQSENPTWEKPAQRYVSFRSNLSIAFQAYKGPLGNDPGIFAYGPFEFHPSETPPTALNYHIYIHSTSNTNILNYFAYGGLGYNDGKTVDFHKLPISPYVADASLTFSRDGDNFLHNVEAYIIGDPRFANGVPIPPSFTLGSVKIPSQNGATYYRYPLVESFISTMAARCGHSRLSHPFGPLDFSHIRDLVSPKFPLRNGVKPQRLVPPDLPYIQVDFHPDEPRHPHDVRVAPFPYYGCLPRDKAFLFQHLFPQYVPILLNMSLATYHLLAMHADPRQQPVVPVKPRVDWETLLEPKRFKEVFPHETRTQLLFRLRSTTQFENDWIPRLAFIQQCTRQVTQLIRLFEAFFQAIGYNGLYEIVDKVSINTDIDFFHNMLLDTDEVMYFTALYDFLLREHAVNLAQAILRLLHIVFIKPYQLGACRRQIVDRIDPPPVSYTIVDTMDSD